VLMIAAALASSAPPLPGFLNALSGTLQHFGLWAIGLLITLEDFGVPVPGETILIAGAIFAGAGRINVVALGVVAFVAAVTGDNIGFAIGHFGGRALVLRWGRYVRLPEERLDKAVLLAGYVAWRVARHRRRRAALARQPAKEQLKDCPPSD